MRLSDKEKIILGTVEQLADQELHVIQQLSKLHTHTINYHLKTLTTKKVVLGKSPFINFYLLGYTDYTIFFSLNPRSQKELDKLILYLKNSEGVSWIAKLVGEFQLGMAICAHQVDDVNNFLIKLSEEFGDIFFQKTLSVRINFTSFGRKYFLKTGKSLKILKASRSNHSILEIDDTDKKILYSLANKDFTSLRQIAKDVAIPNTTFERRFKNLQKKGIIEGFIYRLNLKNQGMRTYRILISSRGISQNLRLKLYKFAEDTPSVIHYIECLGSWDFELGVEVQYSEDISWITQSIYNHFGNYLNEVKIFEVLEHIKYSAYPFNL